MNQERSEEEPEIKSSNDSPVAPPPPPAGAAPAASDPPSFEPKTQPTSGGFPNLGQADAPAAGPATASEGFTATATGVGLAPEPRRVTASFSAGAEEEDLDFDEDDDYEPRKIHLSIARIDPLSTLKMSFLLSVAIGIGIIVATATIWLMLDGLSVFTKIDDLLQSVAGDEAQIEILQYLEFNRVISLATIIAVADVIVITLIATLGSVIYNVVSSLIGGLKLTLTDE